MRPTLLSRVLKYLCLSAGILGCTMHTVLYTGGVDSKGLLISDHWAATGTWLLAGGTIAVLWLLTRSFSGGKTCKSAPSVTGGIGCLGAAAAFVLSSGGGTGEPILLIHRILGLVSAAALAAVAYCRFTGKKTCFLFHGVTCLYLALRMVVQYRNWSADPQLSDYFFYLAAHLTLMFTAYHFAAFDAAMGSYRKLWFWGLSSVFLCCTALPGSGQDIFLLGCILWIFTNLNCPTALSAHRKQPDSGEAG